MPEQIVKQRSRGFLCVNAHPAGCARNVEDQIAFIEANRSPADAKGPKNALVVGASAGYGLASRIALAWGFGAKTSLMCQFQNWASCSVKQWGNRKG